MSVFVNASGSRFIECNCCNALVQSLHGSIVDGQTNDIAPSNWQTDIIRRSIPHMVDTTGGLSILSWLSKEGIKMKLTKLETLERINSDCGFQNDIMVN